MHRRTPSHQLSLPPRATKDSSNTNTESSSSRSLCNGTMSSLPLPVTSLFHPFHSPRKHRLKHRTILFALFGLVAFTCYLLFISGTTLDIEKSLLTHVQDHDRVRAPSDLRQLAVNPNPVVPNSRYQKNQQHLQPVPPLRPQISLSPSEELAALSAFLAALPYNVIPTTVDPNRPLDPQLVLDFDTRSETSKEELDKVIDEVWTRYPVMLFTKLHSADSREIRYMFSNMNLNPAPLVFDVDQREDAQVLIPLLMRLTHVPSLPIVLIGGQPVGTDAQDTKSLMVEIRRLQASGELSHRVLEAGAKVQTGKKKGKKGK
ncbi:hypothetical protein PAXRUDRAFT_823846 [Paxillus rubicundulus Ve08.2h10]|uniref:Glutaredoxin domain-containing protein n=1 Tax=Paxillus rubicundulus Ve08.2h10 TaxID=930991 RepID=A0A0D0E329_9AGAM|nr:hypothetical protein PAXRUDRAFT_823846 [Paxillus rubicundulus Ve08.2h10]